MKQFIINIMTIIKSFFTTKRVKSDTEIFLSNIGDVSSYLDTMKDLIFNDINYISGKHTLRDMWFIANHYRLVVLSQISCLKGTDREIANFRLKQFVDDMSVFDNGESNRYIADNYIYNVNRISHKYNIDIISFKELYI